MKSKAIVTLADSNYFELLLELIESIKRYKESDTVSICVLDAGLNEEQAKEDAKNPWRFQIKNNLWTSPAT